MKGVRAIKKKRVALIILILGIAILSLVLPSFEVRADNRSYYVSDYEVRIQVQPNGDAHVRESVTYDFYGDFNGVIRDISMGRTDGVDDLRVFVVEGDMGFREFTPSEDGDKGTYELNREEDLLKLKVYEKASDQEKTFVYEYVLLNVAERYNDIGVFNRKVIDSNWDVPLNNIDIIISIPEGAKKEDLKVFAHGPLTGVSEIVDHQTFSFRVPEIMPGTFVETFAIFPPELIPDSARVYAEEKLPYILSHEQKLADEANAERERAKEEMRRREEQERERLAREARLKTIRDRLMPAFFAAFIAGIYSLIAFISKYSKGLKPEFEGDYYRELPGDYTPAIMTYLLTKGSVDSKDIMATIMDLVRKKKIAIQEIESEKGFLFKKPQKEYMIRAVEGANLEDLYPHESFLITWFLYKLGGNGSLILDDLKDMLKRNKTALQFHRDYETFQSLVKRQGQKQGFFTDNDLKGSGRYGLIALVLLGAGITSIIYLKAQMGVVIAGIGAVILISMLIVGSLTMLTRYGTEETAKWKAFKRFLLHFSNMDKAEIPSIVIWEHYLVYAISLGVAKEVIDQLPKVFTEGEMMDPTLTYMGGYRSLNSLMLMNSMLTSTTNTISSAVNTASIAASPSSSGSGGGGGFSGGSSGGGGGGGGGGAF